MATTSRPEAAIPKAGFSIDEYCAAISYCRATYYNLPPELRPRSIKIGKRRIIVEPPAEYLARLSAAQQAATAEAAA